jgi:ribosomal protein S20
MKECIKEFNDLIAAGDMKKAGELLPGTYRAIDKAAKRGVIKPNTAARRKSLLAKKLATTAATK